MSVPADAPHLDRSMPNNGRLARFGRFPLVWMLVGVIGIGLVSGLTASGGAVTALLGAGAAVAIYWAVMRFVAGRRMPEIARRGAGREALSGAGVGFGFMVVSASVIAVFGGYSFTWSSGDILSVVLVPAAVALGAAVTEELIFRGLAMQAVERLSGSWVALLVTALVFGFAHLTNPAATAWSSLAIAIQAGVLLGAAFLWRRNIWFVVGLHFAWNTTLGLLGIPVSGHATPGLLSTKVSGPVLLTGGEFGLEASIVPVVVSLMLAVPMLVLARRAGGVLPLRQGRR